MISKSNLNEMAFIMLNYLVKDLPDPGFVEIEYDDSEEGIPVFCAYTEYKGLIDNIHTFKISFDKELYNYENNFIRVIAHEMIHVMQHLRGDNFDWNCPYSEAPHEIEAYLLEDEVADFYLKKVRKMMYL